MKEINNTIDSDIIKLKFNGYENIVSFYSQAGQDLFVLSVLDGKKSGTFLDIGAAWPKLFNNTFLLEKEFMWSGLLIEIDKILCKECIDERTSELICEDATTINYDDIFESFNGVVDYISLDIDGQPTIDVLKNIDFKKNYVGVITFEHDFYRVGDYLRKESREILDQFGYIRLCSDVANGGNPYEDWYVHPDLMNKKLEILKSNNREWEDIIFNK